MRDFSNLTEFLNSFGQNELTYLANAPLCDFSTFKIGGNALFLIFPKCEGAFIKTVEKIKNENVRFTVIGNGSNILFSDKGFDGAVISTKLMNKISLSKNVLYAESGASLTALSLTAQKNSLSGLEFAYGIPGSVGGAVYMNAGAYDGEISAVLKESRYFDPETLEISSLQGSEHDFSYRHSAYMDNDFVILSASFELKEGKCDEIKAKMDSFMQRRAEKQPLNYPSAGSVFKRYPGYFTAKLIDDAGLKGFSVGDAKVSTKHAGFIVNKGNAKAEDVLALIEIIKKKIFENNGIHIETEIKYIE